MQNGFSWLIPGRLAGMPRPGRNGSIGADVEFLAERGITLVVTLTEEPLPGDPFSLRSIELLHLPVPDFSAPTIEQLKGFVTRASAEIGEGGRVAVHCAQGLGRTGTFLASYLIHTGLTAEMAIAEVRRLRPGSIETPEQEAALRDFETLVRQPPSKTGSPD